ncbi:hypothetical protein Pla175_12960 [Pirellulimonas nuda]|uniref:GAF domain-containing protein n=2 Tax=Pirellulimonas nuda TaxID=2528009 RepID=A0A518D8X1_9BACT|nr:hypothetical protein Pla175_12960 [Pirellulimonas nuda]
MRRECQDVHPIPTDHWQVSIVVLRDDSGKRMEVVARSEEINEYPGFDGAFDATYSMARFAGIHQRTVVVPDVQSKRVPFVFPEKQLESGTLRSKMVIPIVVPNPDSDRHVFVGAVSVSSDRRHHFGDRHKAVLEDALEPMLSLLRLIMRAEKCRLQL